MAELYHGCDHEPALPAGRHPKRAELAIGEGFKKLLKSVEKAYKKLHGQKGYKPADLESVPEYRDVIRETNGILNRALEDNHLTPQTQKRLEEDIFLFSGLKTHAQLSEASRQLLTKDKKIKSFSQFSKDVEPIKKNYNENYLDAEYEFATGSVLMADKWDNLDNSGRYHLQYRTANDDRVRETHAAMHNITLPKDDPFWDSYFPPNGWRCRCTTVEVLARNNEASDPKKAAKAGKEATTKIGKSGKNKLAIFRFNPGKQKVVFPPGHPYRKVRGAQTIEGNISRYTPEGLSNYEEKSGVEITKAFFDYLKKETFLTDKNLDPNIKTSGAYYHPTKNYVRIPFDARRKNSKWYSEAIIYHEFGHAADWQNNLKENKAVGQTMRKHRKFFKENNNQGYKELDRKINDYTQKAYKNKNDNELEKIGALADTVMSLNPSFGFGHTKKYFSRKGMKEAEFIAHAFENRFAGNDVFKKLAPELYKDMMKMVDEIKP